MGSRPPLTGYNHNLRYANRIYHVQTEDSGVENPHILSHLFLSGMVLATLRIDYKDLVGDPSCESKVRKMMQEQHKQLMKQLRGGDFDAKVIALMGTLEPPQAAESPSPGINEVASEKRIPLEAEKVIPPATAASSQAIEASAQVGINKEDSPGILISELVAPVAIPIPNVTSEDVRDTIPLTQEMMASIVAPSPEPLVHAPLDEVADGGSAIEGSTPVIPSVESQLAESEVTEPLDLHALLEITKSSTPPPVLEVEVTERMIIPNTSVPPPPPVTSKSEKISGTVGIVPTSEFRPALGIGHPTHFSTNETAPLSSIGDLSNYQPPLVAKSRPRSAETPDDNVSVIVDHPFVETSDKLDKIVEGRSKSSHSFAVPSAAPSKPHAHTSPSGSLEALFTPKLQPKESPRIKDDVSMALPVHAPSKPTTPGIAASSSASDSEAIRGRKQPQHPSGVYPVLRAPQQRHVRLIGTSYPADRSSGSPKHASTPQRYNAPSRTPAPASPFSPRYHLSRQSAGNEQYHHFSGIPDPFKAPEPPSKPDPIKSPAAKQLHSSFKPAVSIGRPPVIVSHATASPPHPTSQGPVPSMSTHGESFARRGIAERRPPSSETSVITRPAVIISQPIHVGEMPTKGQKYGSQTLRYGRSLTPYPPERSPIPTPPHSARVVEQGAPSLFSSDQGTERSLDEVILSYLAEDLESSDE